MALVGPYLSGKTTLLEAILFQTGAIPRQGKVSEKSTVGDAAPEARQHGMSVELNAATTKYLGDSYTFLDCPGSIEFAAGPARRPCWVLTWPSSSARPMTRRPPPCN